MSKARAPSPEPTDPDDGRSAEDEAKAPRAWLFGVLVFVLSLVVYLPALEGPFLWDDELLLRSPNVEELRPVQDYFGSAFWIRPDMEPEGRGYYRPLTILSLALDQRLHAGTSAGFHLTNILFHALNALLVFILARRLRASATTAALLGLLFAWFPRLTEAAAWISGRTDVLAAFFSLLALVLATSSLRYKYATASLSLLFGLFAKEVALAAALGVTTLVWFETPRREGKRRLTRVLPIVLATGLYLTLRTRALSGLLSPTPLSWSERGMAALEAVGRYAFMLVNGFQPNVQIGFLTYRDDKFVALGVLVVLALLIALGVARKRVSPLTAALLSTGLAGIALVCHIVPITVNIVAADRFLYLPLACFVPLATPLFSGHFSRYATAGAALLTLSYAPTTWMRNQVWADKIDFWSTVYREQAIHNAVSRIELGNIFLRDGLFEEADYIYSTADQLDEFHFALTVHNRAFLLFIDGHLDQALPLLEELVAVSDVPKFSLTLAQVYGAANRPQDFQQLLSKLLGQHPELEEAKRLLASLPQLTAAHEKLRLPASTTQEHIEAAQALVQLGISRQAIRRLIPLLAREDFPASEAGPVLAFAFQYATPEELSTAYRRYVGGEAGVEDSLAFAYEARMSEVSRLRALFREVQRE